ncbi:MAG TPA: tripartite tricarboxylate transporter substrate-binding protein [Pseudolabrys sp.]|nr:tripartite tricarboxylate transporter substrate-binding protein [Pseudolabrys sp.]
MQAAASSIAARIVRASLVLMLLLAASSAKAADYPTKPVRIIVPYGPGGIADVTMRLVAQHLSTKFGQQFFIENRPGAGGVVGMQAAKEAPPDGYTLVMLGGGLTIAKALFKSLPYDIETDFAPISTTASYGLVIATKAGSTYKSIRDVIAVAKANPGMLNFGTINAGSGQNLAAELFKADAGINVSIIPYKTTPDLASAVLRGDVDVAFEYFAGFQSQISTGRMTVLATTGHDRAKNLPAVPTVLESGLAGYEVTSWNGLAAPKGASTDLIAQLNRAVGEALAAPDIQRYSSTSGMDASGMAPADLEKRIHADVAKWTRVIDQAGIEKH